MEKELLLKFKNALEKSSVDLNEKIKELENPEDFGDDVDSLEEESDEAEEKGNDLSVAAEYRQKLANVDSALRKMEEEKYGICENCGKEIEEEVLNLVPESDLCKKCKLEANK
jgi:RNA polymerase-binding transcription factor DksA